MLQFTHICYDIAQGFPFSSTFPPIKREIHLNKMVGEEDSLTLIWVIISQSLFICKMGITLHKTAKELSETVWVKNVSEMKSVVAIFLSSL